MFFLFDCDNFFVSCEQVFAPNLKNRPVVVLSNNDGCVISRSAEAKKLGIPMAAPYFKISPFLNKNNGIALSGNHELYSDMSSRIMNILQQNCPNLEIYSIDEAFTNFLKIENPLALAQNIRNQILQQTGVSVSVGIAPSKTLCKIASHCAKKKKENKIYLLDQQENIRKHLQQLDVIDIWGVGRHLAPKLNYLGIFTALELAQTPLKRIRQSFSIRLEKTVLELRGIPCLEIEQTETPQSLTTSRSFASEVNNAQQLLNILSDFTASATARLRQQQAVTGAISVFLRTNRFADTPQYNNVTFVPLASPTAHTGKLIQAMQKGFWQIYHPHVGYKSAGIVLNEIQPSHHIQTTLFSNNAPLEQEQNLMAAMDELNQKFGKKTLRFGSQALPYQSPIRHDNRSPNYTTSWDNLLKVH